MTSLFPLASCAHPKKSNPLERFRLYAALFTWHEEDVIEATVKNAFAQGCERVYLFDNGSPDRTVERGVAAGALHGGTFHTDFFVKNFKPSVLNRAIEEINARERDKHVWWLFIDADEFPAGPRGQTVRDYLTTLDRSFRVVGAFWLDHYPLHEPHYIEGFHPLEFQPLALVSDKRFCPLGHSKHALLRYDKGSPHVTVDAGPHTFTPLDGMVEPPEAMVIHHFKYRERGFILKRFRALCEPDVNGVSRLDLRDKQARKRSGSGSAMSKYRRRMAGLDGIYHGKTKGLDNWRSFVAGGDVDIPRWYGEEELIRAVKQLLGSGFLEWMGRYLVEGKRYGEALEHYRREDVRNCLDPAEAGYQEARCLAGLGDRGAALEALGFLLKCGAGHAGAESALKLLKSLKNGKA